MQSMSDPERLLSGSGSEHLFERALLDDLRVVTVPTQAKGLVWAALTVQGLQAATMAASGAAVTSFWRAAFQAAVSSKAALAVPVLVTALTAGAVLRHRAVAPTPSARPVPVTFAAAPSAPASPTSEPTAPLEAALPRTVHLLSPGPRKDRLARESVLLTRARAELRAGDAALAQGTLSRMQKEFGSGALRQEREVLAIEALAAQGSAKAADRLARAFIAAHPESPHAEPLRRFILQH